MTNDAFELAVIDLASRGVQLTVANVAAYVRMAPTPVEGMLDAMAGAGQLDVELDEDRGVIFYVVRGLTPPPATLALRPIRYPGGVCGPADKRGSKSATVGAVLGLLLPGVGLLYAAPWTAALTMLVATFVSAKMVAGLPLVGWLLSSVALGMSALVSGVLGAMYARKYNQRGRRAHLDLRSATRAAGRNLANPLREAERVALS